MHYWKRYKSTVKPARRILERKQPLSRKVERALLDLLEDVPFDRPEHKGAIKRLLATSEQLRRTRPVEQKSKNGDQEQISMLWVAHACICDGETDVDSTAFLNARKDYEKSARGRVTAVFDYLSQPIPDEDQAPDTSVFGELKDLLKSIATQVPANRWGALAIGLSMYNFHTAGGGRVRKTANWTRMSNNASQRDKYMRPFAEPLPARLSDLIQQCPSRAAGMTSSQVVSIDCSGLRKSRYIPPTRFTASFPLAMGDSADTPRPLVDPQVRKSLDANDSIRFAFMGSFGFAEPSYCTWETGDEDVDPEYDGTRLSLGAYSLQPDFLQSLLGSVQRLGKQSRVAYGKYGSVGTAHLSALLKVSKRNGFALAVQWVSDMVDLATELLSHMQGMARADRLGGVVAFCDFLLAKASRKGHKLSQLEQDGAGSIVAFERLWVLEASLWELCSLATCCLSGAEVAKVCSEKLKMGGCSVGLSDDAIRETVQNIPTSGKPALFERLYGPSGTAVAEVVYQVLNELKFEAPAMAKAKDKLSTFTPYFEFYLGGFLHKDNVQVVDKRVGMQIWVNLSDDLHSEILDLKAAPKEVGAWLAVLLIPHIQSLNASDTRNALVIDFTKFAGEMPNAVVYPILAELADTLRAARYAEHVIFLRSNLKFNTGSLDRYQSGELLLSGKACKGLIAPLQSKLGAFFTEGAANMGAQGWRLDGHYIPLMKKTYLLADLVGVQRWKHYAALW